jgi:hypothetical protein
MTGRCNAAPLDRKNAEGFSGKISYLNKSAQSVKLERMKSSMMNRVVNVTVKTVILSFLILTSSKVFSKEFQRFRIPTGSHLIRNEGTALTATCLDGSARPAPDPGDFISAGSSSISVTRTDGIKRSTVSFNEAIKDKWIKVEGLGRGTSVQISPVSPDPHVEYRLNVESGGRGVIGATDKDVNGMLASLPDEPLPAFAALDKLTNGLESVFGQGSVVTESIRQSKYESESRLAHPQDGQVTSADVVSLGNKIKEMVFPDKLSSEEVLTRSTILKNALLSEEDIVVLQRISPITLSGYDPELKAAAQHFLGHSQGLYESLGRENVVAKRYERGLNELQYSFIDEDGSGVASMTFDKATKLIDAFVLSKPHWEELAVASGKLLDAKALNALKDFAPAGVEFYDAAFLAAWKDFNTSRSLLSDNFGAESQLTRQFQESVRSEFDGDLSAALSTARSTILPKSLRSLNSKPGIGDYVSLLFGQTINANKAEALNKALGWEVEPAAGRLNSFVYLYMDDDEQLVLNTTTSSVQGNNVSLKNVFANHPNVVVEDGLIDGDTADVLRSNGVKFARTFSHLVKSNFPSRPKIKLIYVISNDSTRIAKMFPGQAPSAIARGYAIAREAEVKGLGVIVDSKKGLLDALDSLHADERAVICYHGSENIVLSDADLPLDYLSAHGYSDYCEIFSCNTWGMSEWGMMSLNKIDLETTFGAALKTAETHAEKLSAGKNQMGDSKGVSLATGRDGGNTGGGGGGSNGPPPPRDFGAGVADNFTDLSAKDKKKQILVVGMLVGGGVIAYYIITSDSDSSKEGL